MRKPTTEEIRIMEAAGCRAEDWNKVDVSEDFDVSHVRDVSFAGENELYNCSGKGGIYNAIIRNCSIGEDTLIRNIGREIANYHIGKSCKIENCAAIHTSGESTFGNGCMVKVHNEAGGREVPMFNGLTAQIAYIMCFYRHYGNVFARIKESIDTYCEFIRSKGGRIGSNVSITDCGEISDVIINDSCVIEGAVLLKNGTVGFDDEYGKLHVDAAPATIGRGVQAGNFIILGGSKVSGGAMIENCFIGEAVEIGKQFSAENCLVFSNSQLFHGEACSVFAGPFTVSHHKSTLLIGGTFSFYNAGSGTNQSNHLYKSGPRHSGILERGSKTASGSYLMWPARTGAFTVVLGKHCTHFDTTCLPFSYIVEKNGCSFIKPAINLTSYGTWRDINKWQQRDKRSVKRDLTDFDINNPYILQRLQHAIEFLDNLRNNSFDKDSNILLIENDADCKPYKHLYIYKKDLDNAINLYDMAVLAILGHAVENLKSLPDDETDEMPETENSCHTWIDMAGLYTTVDEVQRILNEICGQPMFYQDPLKILKASLDNWHTNRRAAAWLETIGQASTSHRSNGMQPEELATICKEAQKTLTRLIDEDKDKEDHDLLKIGFGMDGVCGKDDDYRMTLKEISGN